jgi:Holliday junction resolvase RusA-like endonuclease
MRQPTEFWVSGIPAGQPRPRAFIRNGSVRVYDPGTAEGWKGQIAVAFRDLPFIEPWAGPVALTMKFYFPRPRSHFRTGRHAELMRDDSPVWHTGKPDSDNLAKAVADTLTHLALWKDDAQVCRMIVSKQYGDKPGCFISVSEP